MIDTMDYTDYTDMVLINRSRAVLEREKRSLIGLFPVSHTKALNQNSVSISRKAYRRRL